MDSIYECDNGGDKPKINRPRIGRPKKDKDGIVKLIVDIPSELNDMLLRYIEEKGKQIGFVLTKASVVRHILYGYLTKKENDN